MLPTLPAVVRTLIHRGFPHSPPGVAPVLPLDGFLSTPRVDPPSPLNFATTHNGCAALPAQLSPTLVSLFREAFGRFEDILVPLIRLFRYSGPQRGVNCKHRGGGVFRLPLGGLKNLKVFSNASTPSLHLPARSRVPLVSHRAEHNPTG